MTYFKVIKDDKVVDVGFVFLRWNSKHKNMRTCEPNDAQYVLTDSYQTYHPSWLVNGPAEAGEYETPDVEVITFEEYDELKALLDDGEEIDVLPPPEPTPVPEPDQPEEDKPMTVSEMRQTIIEQQSQIEMLTNCILEMSELLYK